MKITTVAGAVTAFAAALALTACGSTMTPQTSAPPATSPSAAPAASAQHNDADIAFVQGMIPHHAQAVAMAQMATAHASDQRVKELAGRIEQAQGPEIAQMRGFLAAWGVPESSGGMPGMDHGQMGQNGMSGGMMSDQQMQQMGQAQGAAFDRMFLQQMTQHHEGAVQMARTELSSGTNPEAKALAQRIIDAQQAEISEMKQLLST